MKEENQKNRKKHPDKLGRKQEKTKNVFAKHGFRRGGTTRGFWCFFNITARWKEENQKNKKKHPDKLGRKQEMVKNVFCEAWFSPRRDDEGFLLFSFLPPRHDAPSIYSYNSWLKVNPLFSNSLILDNKYLQRHDALSILSDLSLRSIMRKGEPPPHADALLNSNDSLEPNYLRSIMRKGAPPRGCTPQLVWLLRELENKNKKTRMLNLLAILRHGIRFLDSFVVRKTLFNYQLSIVIQHSCGALFCECALAGPRVRGHKTESAQSQKKGGDRK